MKEHITARIDKAVLTYIEFKSRNGTLNKTQILNQLLKLGLQNRKENEEALEQMRKTALEMIQLTEADEEIRVALKRAYLVANFKKLIWKLLQEKEITKTRYNEVKKPLLKRLKQNLTIEEYAGVIEWLSTLEK